MQIVFPNRDECVIIVPGSADLIRFQTEKSHGGASVGVCQSSSEKESNRCCQVSCSFPAEFAGAVTVRQ